MPWVFYARARRPKKRDPRSPLGEKRGRQKIGPSRDQGAPARTETEKRGRCFDTAGRKTCDRGHAREQMRRTRRNYPASRARAPPEWGAPPRPPAPPLPSPFVRRPFFWPCRASSWSVSCSMCSRPPLAVPRDAPPAVDRASCRSLDPGAGRQPARGDGLRLGQDAVFQLAVAQVHWIGLGPHPCIDLR